MPLIPVRHEGKGEEEGAGLGQDAAEAGEEPIAIHGVDEESVPLDSSGAEVRERAGLVDAEASGQGGPSREGAHVRSAPRRA